jgi:adenylate cyclase
MAHPIARSRLRLERTLRIALAWVVVGALASLFEHNVLVSHGVETSLWERFDAGFWRSLAAGLLGGGLYIFVLRDLLRGYSYTKAFALMAALMLPVLAALEVVLKGGAHTLASLAFLGHYLYWTMLMGGTMLLVRLNDQYGDGGVGYLTGRYFKPRQEMRIFMFLDMRSSTTIAEKIGHLRYFELLNELFTDITDPIMYSRGEIYQYVGDEISVSWPLRRGLKRQRCVRCFLDIRAKLERRAQHYQARYGIVPTFKAGFHYGAVTTGEVGVVKRERIFSGDAVNTAARIQNTCNTYGVDNLFSQELLDVLHLPGSYRMREIGSITLKGKSNAMRLWTLEHDEAPAQGA